MANPQQNKRPAPERDRTAMRACLYKQSKHCKGTFKSHGPGHRMCPACKEALRNRGEL